MDHRVATTADFKGTELKAIEVGDLQIVLVKHGSEFFAMEDRCSHAGVMLSGGSLNNGDIECPAHGAKFCLKTGRALCMPAVNQVRTFPVKIKGSEIFVEI